MKKSYIFYVHKISSDTLINTVFADDLQVDGMYYHFYDNEENEVAVFPSTDLSVKRGPKKMSFKRYSELKLNK